MTKRQSKRIIDTYEDNKIFVKGAKLPCPVCGQTFVKKNKVQTFCSTKCKNAFWNRTWIDIDEKKILS